MCRYKEKGTPKLGSILAMGDCENIGMRGEGGVKWRGSGEGGWFEQYERLGAHGLGRFGCTDSFDGDVGERKVGRLKRLYSQLRIQDGGRNLCKLRVVWGR